MSQNRPGRSAQIARWSLRGVMILAILAIAIQRGFGGPQMAGVVLAIVWALSLPVVLTWTWRFTKERPNWQRAAATLIVALLLLGAFTAGVRPLLA